MPLTFTAEQAAKIVAEEAGFDFATSDGRAKSLDWLNRIREWMWRFRFVRGWPIDENIPVEQFLSGYACSSTYNGIALPVSGLTAVQIETTRDGSPVKIVARGGVEPMNRPSNARSSCEVKAVQMGEHSLRHDPPADDVYYYWVRSTSHDDNGKTVRLSYINATGKHIDDEIILAADGNRTKEPVMRLLTPSEFGGISLPADLQGVVRIGCYKGADGGMNGEGPYHSLCEIPPGVTAPSWMRYQLHGVCCGKVVHVEAQRDFVPITSFLSWVESNKGELWRAGYRYVRGMNQQSVDEQIVAANTQNSSAFVGFVTREQEAIYGIVKSRSVRFEGFLSPYAPSRLSGRR